MHALGDGHRELSLCWTRAEKSVILKLDSNNNKPRENYSMVSTGDFSLQCSHRYTAICVTVVMFYSGEGSYDLLLTLKQVFPPQFVLETRMFALTEVLSVIWTER